jgi:hypothetical protein
MKKIRTDIDAMFRKAWKFKTLYEKYYGMGLELVRHMKDDEQFTVGSYTPFSIMANKDTIGPLCQMNDVDLVMNAPTVNWKATMEKLKIEVKLDDEQLEGLQKWKKDSVRKPKGEKK